MSEPVVKLQPGKSDSEVAKELKDDLSKMLGLVVDEMNAAHKNGMVVSFNIQTDLTGHSFVASLDVMKKL
jgi:hypothetical protein